MQNTVYKKSQSQIALENILHLLKYSNLKISELRHNKKYQSLNHDFNEALTGVINILVHEQSIHHLITSIALSYPSQYYDDLKEFDTLLEVMSCTILGLNSTITKFTKVKDKNGNHIVIDNRGRIRIDTFQDKDPEVFILTLRWYIRNNIIMDLARHLSRDVKHIVPETITFDENELINKLDSVKCNKYGIENEPDFTEAVCRQHSYDHPDMKIVLLDSIISRFHKKPVAGYIYLSILNQTYDPMTIIHNLKTTKDFNSLFHSLIPEVESNYNVNLSHYNNIIFSADKYINSFRKRSVQDARRTIDKLKSQTCKDVSELPLFKLLEKNHIRGKNFIL